MGPACGTCPKSGARLVTKNESGARSDKADPRALERNSPELGSPNLTRGDGTGARQRSRGHDFARGERRVVGILRQRLNEMAQRKEWPVEDICRRSVVDSGCIAEELDLEARQLQSPRVAPWLGLMTRPDEEPAMQAVGGDGVRRPERPTGED